MTKPPRPVLDPAKGWLNTGRERPTFAIAPGPGQESVWDYPRPPRLAPDTREVVVRAGEILVARSSRAIRVLETASPPTFYLPPEDILAGALVPCRGSSHCEWKGEARYFSLAGSANERPVAWAYAHPFSEFEAIRDRVCFYPSRVECFVAGIRVKPQAGEFYGGWVTPEVVGPFKGDPGTSGW